MNHFLLNECRLCPRQCGVNRNLGERGFCGSDHRLLVARATLHFWEEPCISGERGSGTVFFSGCPLRCVYCQNHNIAGARAGKEISVERLADIFLELEQKGAHNINLVTPTHYVPHILSALEIAKQKGLSLPIVYNCGGYESVSALKRLEGAVDIYLPDFKYLSSETAEHYSRTKNYPEIAKAALAEMHRQTGSLCTDAEGMAKRGMIVRHLVLPGHSEESKQVIQYLHETYGNDIFLSIMNQYTPMPTVQEMPPLNRKLTAEEYDDVIDYAISIGVENAFVQEEGTAEESFIPEFDLEGV